jgi:hypothetical protein
MLLNEFRVEHARLQAQAAMIADGERQSADEEAQIKAHAGEIEALKAAQKEAAQRQRAIEALKLRVAALEKLPKTN